MSSLQRKKGKLVMVNQVARAGVNAGMQILKNVFIGAVVTGVGLGVGNWVVDGVRAKLRDRQRSDS